MSTLGSLNVDASLLTFARFAITAFFAVVFLQSALDKMMDPEGNLGFLREHFKNAPIPADLVGPIFWTLTALELIAGVFCSLGILFGGFVSGTGFARQGIKCATLVLLALIAGQRVAKDYAGAAVVASYFAVAILGLVCFSIGR